MTSWSPRFGPVAVGIGAFASRLKISSNSMVSSMSRTVSKPTKEDCKEVKRKNCARQFWTW